MSSTESVLIFAVIVFVSVMVFLILREFFAWYWKINQIVALLEEIRDRLPEPGDGDQQASAQSEY